MKKTINLALAVLTMVLLTAAPLFAEVIEPVNKINISPIAGPASSGTARAYLSYEKYEFGAGTIKDIEVTTLQAELSMKLIDDVGIGIIVPYLSIETEFSGGGGAGQGDDSGLGNILIGGHVLLPPPKEGIFLVVGANVRLPTSDDDVGRKLTGIEPYVLGETRFEKISLTTSLGYELIVDEDTPAGQSDIYENVLSLQGSALYSATDVFAIGAQIVIKTAEKTMIDLIPQVRVRSGVLEWGVAVELPLRDNYYQEIYPDKDFVIIFYLAYKF